MAANDRKMLKPCLALSIAMFASMTHAEPIKVSPGIAMIPGTSVAGRQPDGNSILIDAPKGLILIDTGRHKAQQDAIIAFARASRKPVAAIFNTHWHLDHSGGNAEMRAAFPAASLYASNAIEGALRGFLPKSRSDAESFVKSGKAPPGLAADIALDIAAIENPESLRPTHPVTASKAMKVAGRRIDVHLAPFAATEGDIWLLDRKSGVLVAGDLVVAAAPYFDTACAEGWRKALDEIASQDFETLIPGHGDPMNRTQFLNWRKAFNTLLDCAASDATNAACIVGWKRDAAAFIPAGERRIDGLIGYYLDTRLRAEPAERERYCRPQ